MKMVSRYRSVSLMYTLRNNKMTETKERDDKPQTAAKKKPKKKELFKWSRVFAVLFVLIMIWWFNNYTLRTTKVTLYSSKIKEPIRIAVISDQHATKHGISNKSICKRIKKNDPDAVMILGDMYTTDSPQELRQIPIDLTADIVKEGYPVFFVNGEHDTDRKYIEAQRKAGAHIMDYKSEKINIKGNDVCVYGIDNVYYSETFNLFNEFQPDESCYNILLAHIPNYKKFEEFGADLTLCADTHGCMVQLPFDMGPVFYSDAGEWFPQFKDMEVYDKGTFDYKGGTMFITSGIGVSPLPIRVNNRPEVAIIDVLPEKQAGK